MELTEDPYSFVSASPLPGPLDILLRWMLLQYESCERLAWNLLFLKSSKRNIEYVIVWLLASCQATGDRLRPSRPAIWGVADGGSAARVQHGIARVASPPHPPNRPTGTPFSPHSPRGAARRGASPPHIARLLDARSGEQDRTLRSTLRTRPAIPTPPAAAAAAAASGESQRLRVTGTPAPQTAGSGTAGASAPVAVAAAGGRRRSVRTIPGSRRPFAV